MSNKFVAIILAAGYSSRMGKIKALLPFGNHTLIERLIYNFKNAKIDKIIVVLGYQKEIISTNIKNLDIQIVHNQNFDDGMYSSVVSGVRASTDCDAFFICPTDYPLIDKSTLKIMIDRYNSYPEKVIYPVYNEKKGHPPLIDKSVIPDILSSSGDGGLKNVLSKYNDMACYLPVDDPYILMDMDTPSDYQKCLDIFSETAQKKYPL